MSSKDKNQIIQKTGEMLLSGWKLLGLHCPICSTALLSKDDNMRCPSCDAPVLTESQVEINNRLTNVISFGEEKKCEIVNDDLLEPKSIYELNKDIQDLKSKRDDISSKLGQKMLLGWTMLGETCQNELCRGTPLMKEGSHGTMICVGCDSKYIVNIYGQIESERVTLGNNENSIKPKTEKVITLFDNNDVPVLKYHEESIDDVISNLIGKKLLTGWALLDKVCAKCNKVPLMRDFDQKEHCVSCDRMPAAVILSKNTNKRPTNLEIDEECDEEEFDIDEIDDVEIGYAEYVQDQLKQRNNLSNEAKTSSTPSKVVSILEKKLLQIAQLLESEANVHECMVKVELLHKLTAAIIDVRKLCS